MGSNIIVRDHRGPSAEGKDPQTLGIMNRVPASAWAMQEIVLLLHSIAMRRMKTHLSWSSWASEVDDPARAVRCLMPISPNARLIRVRFMLTPCRFAATAEPEPAIAVSYRDRADWTAIVNTSVPTVYHAHRDDSSNLGPINWSWHEVTFAVVGGHTYELVVDQLDKLQIAELTVTEQPADWLDPATDLAAVDASDYVELHEILGNAFVNGTVVLNQLSDLWDAVQRVFDDQGGIFFAWCPHNQDLARTIPQSTAALANIFDTTKTAWDAASLGFWCWPKYMGTFESDNLEVIIWAAVEFSATPTVNDGRQVEFRGAPGLSAVIGTINIQGMDPGASVDTAFIRLQTTWIGASLFDSDLIQVFAKNPSAAETMRIRAAGMYAKAPFDPRVFDGLKVWLAADRLTGLADGAAVASWTDMSGNGNHAVQATGANQPIYKTGIVQGRPVVRFDGANDFLKIADAASLKPTRPYVWCVCKSDNVAAVHQAVVGYAHAVSGVGFRYGFSINPSGNDTIKTWKNNVGTDLMAGVAYANVWRIYWLWPSHEILYRDGILKGAQVIADITYPTATGVYVGAQSDGAAGTFFDGDIAEILIVDAFGISQEQIYQVEQYLSEKYAIAVGKDWTAT